jgi:sialate O-acetylesterase
LKDFEGDLLAYSSKDPSGFELCGDAEGSCQFVTAILAGKGMVQLVGDTSRLPPGGPSRFTRVRYCWADSPLCNLFDGAGLPVGPFEIAITQGR